MRDEQIITGHVRVFDADSIEIEIRVGAVVVCRLDVPYGTDGVGVLPAATSAGTQLAVGLATAVTDMGERILLALAEHRRGRR